MNGQMNPNAGITSDEFELSSEPSFASFTTLPAAGAGPGTATVALSANATSLNPGTTYYYRLVSTNGGSPGHDGGGSATRVVTNLWWKSNAPGCRRGSACPGSGRLPLATEPPTDAAGAEISLLGG